MVEGAALEMLCGVTATLGSNPSATATAARPHWGWAALLCPTGVSLGGGLGYRTLRVAGGVTFRRVGVGKSVF